MDHFLAGGFERISQMFERNGVLSSMCLVYKAAVSHFKYFMLCVVHTVNCCELLLLQTTAGARIEHVFVHLIPANNTKKYSSYLLVSSWYRD